MNANAASTSASAAPEAWELRGLELPPWLVDKIRAGGEDGAGYGALAHLAEPAILALAAHREDELDAPAQGDALAQALAGIARASAAADPADRWRVPVFAAGPKGRIDLIQQAALAFWPQGSQSRWVGAPELLQALLGTPNVPTSGMDSHLALGSLRSARLAGLVDVVAGASTDAGARGRGAGGRIKLAAEMADDPSRLRCPECEKPLPWNRQGQTWNLCRQRACAGRRKKATNDDRVARGLPLAVGRDERSWVERRDLEDVACPAGCGAVGEFKSAGGNSERCSFGVCERCSAKVKYLVEAPGELAVVDPAAWKRLRKTGLAGSGLCTGRGGAAPHLTDADVAREEAAAAAAEQQLARGGGGASGA